MNFFTDHPVLFALVCAGVAIAYGIGLTYWVLQQPAGNERMREISRAVQEGAAAYLRRQYITVAAVAVVPFLVLGLYNQLGWGTAFGFLVGAVLSAAAGFIGMNVAVRANVRTAEAARRGLAPALNVAFRAGSVTGLLVVGLGLLGVAGYYWVLTDWLEPFAGLRDQRPDRARVRRLADLGLRASRRRHLHQGRRRGCGPGREDRGGHPRGRPAEPGRDRGQRRRQRRRLRGHGGRPLRDLRGDRRRRDAPRLALRVVESGVVPARARRHLDPRVGRRNVVRARRSRRQHHECALRRGARCDGAVGSRLHPRHDGLRQRPVFVRRPLHLRDRRARGDVPARRHHRVLHGHALVPVKSISRSSQTGHATNIIEGLAVGMQATALPVIVIATGILVAHHFAGLYGIGVAVMAQLSMTGLIVALDAYGPVTDNAGGIAEMADLPPEVRAITDPLDAVGNTTKAVTKGYAIGSAALAALVLFDSYTTGLRDEGLPAIFSLSDAWVIAGLFIGGLMPFLFASLAMQAVGRVGGEVVQEVRRQFREDPGIMEGTSRPEYGRAIDIVTELRDQEHARAGADPDRRPDHRRDHQRAHARRVADRDDRHRPLPRDRDDVGRRRVGQREEADRGRRLRREGLRGPRGGGHRRHGRRSLQGHRRPRDQPDDQDHEHRGDPDHPVARLDPRVDRGRDCPAERSKCSRTCRAPCRRRRAGRARAARRAGRPVRAIRRGGTDPRALDGDVVVSGRAGGSPSSVIVDDVGRLGRARVPPGQRDRSRAPSPFPPRRRSSSSSSVAHVQPFASGRTEPQDGQRISNG